MPLPLTSATVLPNTVLPVNTLTVLPGTAVPENVGVLTLVIPSDLLTPVSGLMATIAGLFGAVASRLKWKGLDEVLMLPT